MTHTLADLLRSRDLDPATIVAIRNDLHPSYISDEFRIIAADRYGDAMLTEDTHEFASTAASS